MKWPAELRPPTVQPLTHIPPKNSSFEEVNHTVLFPFFEFCLDSSKQSEQGDVYLEHRISTRKDEVETRSSCSQVNLLGVGEDDIALDRPAQFVTAQLISGIRVHVHLDDMYRALTHRL